MFFKQTTKIGMEAAKLLKSLGLPEKTLVWVASPMKMSNYRQLGFQNHAGTAYLPPTSPLTRLSNGYRTLITQAHKGDLIFNIATPNVQMQSAMLLNSYEIKPDGSVNGTRLMAINASENPQVISTTNSELHEIIRDERKVLLVNERPIERRENERFLGGIEVDVSGAYFGGNPTTCLPISFREQIHADITVFSSGVPIATNREETAKHGPRISAHKETSLIVDEQGQYRQESSSDRAFVNSTIHRGIQKGVDRKDHPTTYYTPGDGLLSFSKQNVAERHDGTVLQTISLGLTASADVLSHWFIKFITELWGKHKNYSGLTRQFTEKGLVESIISHQGWGGKLHAFALLLTGTPFDMTTITVHRDKEGNPLSIMINKRTKPWPANETNIQITGPNNEKICEIYQSIIPDTGFWEDFTVGKLLTPIPCESVNQYSIQGDKLVPIIDKELLKDMKHENEKGLFTYKELMSADSTSLGMAMSAAGFNRKDTRSSVIAVSTTGKFDHEALANQHIAQDPVSMESYYCSRAMRIIAENIEAVMKNNYSFWTENEDVRKLWSAATSEKTPSYPNMVANKNKYETVIRTIMKDPAEMQQLNQHLVNAAKAHEVAKNVGDHKILHSPIQK